MIVPTDFQALVVQRLDAAVALGFVGLCLIVVLLAIIAVRAMQS